MTDRKQKGSAPKLLSGGNPQIPKGDGDAPVQAFIDAMPGWKHDVGRRLDDLIVAVVPDVQRAVRWNSPFYGVEGNGWFANFHCYTRYVKVTFFNGASLRPQPPEHPRTQTLGTCTSVKTKFDEKQMKRWIGQAAANPGWNGF